MLKQGKHWVLVWSISLTMFMIGCGEFDAKGYVQAYLNAMLQGEVTDLMKFEPEQKQVDLKNQHEEQVALFAEGLTEGLQVSDGMQYQFQALCEEIFRTSRYQVIASKKINRKEYQVTIEYEPSNVFALWTTYLSENAVDIQKRVDSGEYQGTEEEKLQQVLLDIAAESCELLDTAIIDATYQKEEQTILTVKKDKNGDFAVDQEEFHDFIGKIMDLDEITG